MLNVAGDNASQSARAFVRRVVDDFPTHGTRRRAGACTRTWQWWARINYTVRPNKNVHLFEYFSQKSANFLQLLVHIYGKHTNKLTISAIFTYLKFHLAYDVTIDYLRCIKFLRKAAEIRSDA